MSAVLGEAEFRRIEGRGDCACWKPGGSDSPSNQVGTGTGTGRWRLQRTTQERHQSGSLPARAQAGCASNSYRLRPWRHRDYLAELMFIDAVFC